VCGFEKQYRVMIYARRRCWTEVEVNQDFGGRLQRRRVGAARTVWSEKELARCARWNVAGGLNADP